MPGKSTSSIILSLWFDLAGWGLNSLPLPWVADNLPMIIKPPALKKSEGHITFHLFICLSHLACGQEGLKIGT